MNYQRLVRWLGFAIMFLTLTVVSGLTAAAQQPTQWTPQQRIPGYADDTEPPYLIADQNRTVHAFASQQVGEGGTEIAIIYSQWTLEGGWTTPIDILLSPLKHQARLMGALLDQSGMMHVIFFGGDETEANIYYAKAPAVSADRAPAWSAPKLVGESAVSPSMAALAGDDKGNLVVVYSGNREGNGLYAVNSSDGGDTWSEPVPMFLTYSNELWPFSLQMHAGQSGWLHAVWNVVDVAGQGRSIYYAKLKVADGQWSDPVELEQTPTGLGSWFPSVIEQDGNLLVIYIAVPKVTMRRSNDGGQTWADRVILFPRHVGLNGPPSLVKDGNGDLHLFFGQRIPASPDIHGMWHSIWQSDRWSEPEAVVSGPRVSDYSGNRAFDPTGARAVNSQGSVLLVTWRSDYGLKGNGVWYSYQVLDASELPLVALPPPPVTPTATHVPTATPGVSAPAPTPRPIVVDQKDVGSEMPSNPATPLVLGIIPVMLLILVLIVTHQSSRYRRY